MMLLVPRDLLRPRRPDEHFADEADAARDLGLTVALVDHDALARVGGAHDAVAAVPAEDDVVYRGWMLPATRYADMELALARRGASLRTTSSAFRRAHELPGWYPALVTWTPESVWTESDTREHLEIARRALASGPAVVRDHVKSEKHRWDEACFVPDLTDARATWRIASRLRELRDEAFTGGYVLRRFEAFTGPEVRTWWVEGTHVLHGPHPDTPDQVASGFELPEGLTEAVAGLGLPFVTVDLVRHADGRWRVVELGDGQVSDRPRTLAAQDLLAALCR